jgi:hypothetical protein
MFVWYGDAGGADADEGTPLIGLDTKEFKWYLKSERKASWLQMSQDRSEEVGVLGIK